MRFFFDILVFVGAILLTFGTDLVIETAGEKGASLGGPLGVIFSLIGVALLTAGLLNHYRLSRDHAREPLSGSATPSRRTKSDRQGA